MRETDSRGSTTHLIFGIRPVLEALEAGKDIDKIFVQNLSFIFCIVEVILSKLSNLTGLFFTYSVSCKECLVG